MAKQANLVPDKVATIVVHPTPGVGDATTIVDGLAMLPTAGGSILLREGTYSLTTTVTLPDKPVTILGCGDSTIISLGASAIAAFTIPTGLTAERYFVFEDMAVTGTSVAAQKIWSIEDANSRGIMHATRVNSTDVQIPVHVTASNPVTIFSLDDCHFSQLVDGSSILVNTVGALTVNANMHRVRFYTAFQDTVTGALTTGGFYGTFTGVNIIGEDCIFSVGTGGTMGAIALTNCQIFNFGPGANPIIAVAGDNSGTLPDSLIGCGAQFVNFNFAGTGTRIYGGSYGTCSFTDGAISFFDNVYFFDDLTADAAVIVGGGSTFISNCWFDNTGTAYVLDGNFASIIGNHFQTIGVTAIIRTTNGSAKISDNEMIANTAPAILEVTSSTNRIDNNHWSTGPTLLASSDAVINGVKRKNTTGATSTDSYVELFTHVNDKGLLGIGTVKNTDGANSLTVKETVIDAFGVTDSLETVVPFGTNYILSLTIRPDIGSFATQFTNAFPPYVSYKVEVKSTSAGNSATYEARHADQGAY